jgi:outer membrane immunogenic protein
MIKHFFSAFCVTALASIPVHAADMVTKAPVYKALPAAVPTSPWTGCYVGGYVGGAWGGDVGASDLTGSATGFPTFSYFNGPGGPAPSYAYRLDGAVIGGGTLGCNYQVNQWVIGLEGEVGHLRLTRSIINPNSVPYNSDMTDSTKVGDFYGVIAGRLGMTFDRLLVYVKGGAAFLKVTSSIVDTCNSGSCGTNLINATGSNNRAHVAVGGGLEYAVTGNWTLKGEYLWLGLRHNYSVCGVGGGDLTNVGSPTLCSNHDVGGVHTVKIGLNYKFASGLLMAGR